MKIRTIKTSFNGGEISKQLYGRVDLENFIACNKEMKNMLPTIYGGVINRGGTIFVSESAVSDSALWFTNKSRQINIDGGLGITSIQPISNVKFKRNSVDGGQINIDKGWLVGVSHSDASHRGYSVVFCDENFNVIHQIYHAGDVETVEVYMICSQQDSCKSLIYVGQSSWSEYRLVTDGDFDEEDCWWQYRTGGQWGGYIKPLCVPNVAEEQNSSLFMWTYANTFEEWKLLNYRKNILKQTVPLQGTSDMNNRGLYCCGGRIFCFNRENNVSWLKTSLVDDVLNFRESPCFVNDETVVSIDYYDNTYVMITKWSNGAGYTYIYKYVSDNGYDWTRTELYSFNENNQNLGAFIYYKNNNNEVLSGTQYSVWRTEPTQQWQRNGYQLPYTTVRKNFVFENKKFVFGGNIHDRSLDMSVSEFSKAVAESRRRILVPFKVNKNINYIVEFGDRIVRFYRNRIPVFNEFGMLYEIPSPYSLQDLIDDTGKLKISYIQNIDVLYICHPDLPVQVLKRYGDANWVIEEFNIVKGPFGEANSDKNKVLTCSGNTGMITINTRSANFELTMVLGNGEQYNYFNRPLTVWYLDGTEIANVNRFMSVEEAVALLYSTSHGPNFVIQISGNTIHITANSADYSGKTLRLFRRQVIRRLVDDIYLCRKYDDRATFSSSAGFDLFTAQDEGKLIRLNYTDYNTVMWEVGKSVSANNIRKSGNNYYIAKSSGTTGQIKPIHTEGTVSDGGVMWEYLHSGYGVGKILEVVSPSQIKVNADGYFPDFSMGTYLWEFGIVGGGVYPSCCAFYKERFVFAISTNKGTKICASCAGDYNNFSDNSYGDILDENAITVMLQGSQESAVLWMSAKNKLIISTACEEFIFGEQTIAEVLSPTNVMCVKAGNLGSAPLMPLSVLDELFFVSNNEKQIVNFSFFAEKESYRPINISLMFEHLLQNGVRCWEYTKEPYKIIWFADNIGNLYSVSYDAENKVCAGARHDIGGKVVSMAVIPEPFGYFDELWLVVERNINGKTVYYTEIMGYGLPVETASNEFKNSYAVFGDCGKVFRHNTDVSSVNGLDYLEGQMVNVVVDGKVQNNKYVVNGSISLDEPGKIIMVGLPYEWFTETLFFNIGANNGSAQGLPQRVSKLIFRTINTRYCKAIASGGNRYEVVCDKDMICDGDYEVYLPSDYSRQMTIRFGGDKPVSCRVLMIVAEMETCQ